MTAEANTSGSAPANPARARVGIIYPSDPLGSIPGGIDSFVRGIIRCAPQDIAVSVVGTTTDAVARPVNRWTECAVGQASYHHYPVYEHENPGRQPRIPAIVRFMARLFPHLRALRGRFDVLESHRIEPFALFLRDPTPKTAVFHQNMEVIRSADSDIRWRHLPSLYFWMEGALLRHLSSAFFVREDAVAAYRKRYPELADRFRFTPTWVDPEFFHPVDAARSADLRDRLLRPRGVLPSDRVLITVGRLDRQKDPLLLASAFAELCRTHANVRLVLVGDGTLRNETETLLHSLGVADRAVFTGLLSPTLVAEHLNASDLFVLASAYEGMPMSLLEAMGCGLPACTTDVGEVRRVVSSGINGEIVTERTPAGLARAFAHCIERLNVYRGAPAVAAARAFVPERVLAPFYENYRRLAARGRAS